MSYVHEGATDAAIAEVETMVAIDSRELAGRVALAEKHYKTAAAAFREANQQDPRVLYLQALADQGQGDLPAAKQACILAADWNALSPTYGYVRGKAKAMLRTADRD